MLQACLDVVDDVDSEVDSEVFSTSSDGVVWSVLDPVVTISSEVVSVGASDVASGLTNSLVDDSIVAKGVVGLVFSPVVASVVSRELLLEVISDVTSGIVCSLTVCSVESNRSCVVASGVNFTEDSEVAGDDVAIDVTSDEAFRKE